MIQSFLASVTSLKVGYASAAGLFSSTGYSAWLLVAQVGEGGGGGSIGGETVIPAAALTATASALVYVVKKIAAGELVHRDPATAEAELRKLSEDLAEVAAASLKREEILNQMLMKGLRQDQKDG